MNCNEIRPLISCSKNNVDFIEGKMIVIIKTSKQISLSIKNNFINNILFLKANDVNTVFKQHQR